MKSFLLLSLFSVLVFPSAKGDFVPLRFVAGISYDNETDFDRNAKDVFGLRIGFFCAANKRMYGMSITGLFDGEDPTMGSLTFDNAVYDDDWAGLKIGGVSSFSCGSGYGVQVGGLIAGTDGRMRGIQMGGFGCEAGRVEGVQISFMCSSADVSMNGIQIGVFTGCGNVHLASTSSSTGIQIGGITASVGPFTGLQMGFYTHATELHGIQIGVINQADSLHGIQIGAINLSGTRDEGNYRCIPVVNIGF